MGDSVFRAERKRGFAVVYRDVAQDKRLSLKARGLFLMMASLPENWEYTIAGLAAKAGTGKDQIRSALAELLEVGYLAKEQAHDRCGKFSANVFVLQDEAPLSGKPTTGKPTTENPTVNNKEKKKKERNPPISPEGEARFRLFWEAYPRKAAKQDARKAWSKINPDEVLLGVMIRSLTVQAKSEQWIREGGRFIPLPATWLNGCRWEDEVKSPIIASSAPVDEEGFDGI